MISFKKDMQDYSICMELYDNVENNRKTYKGYKIVVRINAVNKSERSALVLVYCDGTYIGNFSINECGGIRYKHRATIGIVFHQRYTGLGIGSFALNWIIELAKELKYSQLELEVFANNKRAIRLYERLGFQKYGIFPEYAHYSDGCTDDVYWMMKKL